MVDLTGLGSVADLASGIINKFFPDKMSDAEKAAAELEIKKMLQQRETALLETQKAVIVAELNQGDNFTKRARPTLVYAGLGFIFLVHVILPMLAFFLGREMPRITLPEEFWWAWSGVCGAWVIGRSAERRGVKGKMLDMVTGGR